MKNRLKQIQTSYNNEGKSNQDAYFTEKSKMYQKQIEFAKRVDAITDRQFALKPLQIGFVQSQALKDQPKFKQIRKILNDYNKQVNHYFPKNNLPQRNQVQEKAIKGLHLKTVVMDSMLKFMRLLLFAPDKKAKIAILDVAHHWFIQNLDPKQKRKNQNELQKQIKKILIEKQLLPIDVISRSLIDTKIKEETIDYKKKARTQYRQIDPPSEQLQNYNTHKLGLGQMQGQKKDKNNKKWIQNVKFPQIQLPSYYIEDGEKEEELRREELRRKEEEQKKFRTQGTADVPPENQVQEQVKQGQQNIQNVQELDFGIKDEDQEPEEEEEVQDKKRGKLDPLVKAFIRERQMQKQKKQYSAERIEEKKFNKKQMFQREDNLAVNYLKKWSAYRSRLKTQMARKNESMKGFSGTSKAKLQKNSQNYLETQLDKIKVNKTLNEHNKKLQQDSFVRQNLNTQAGVSLFDRRRIKTDYSQKPFSSILDDYSRDNEQQIALNQATEIKEKFSKNKIYTPFQNLMKGLSNSLENEIVDKDLPKDKITLPPCQLISNPFIKVAKKKKKKKKK